MVRSVSGWTPPVAREGERDAAPSACADCGLPLDAALLAVSPGATRCGRCAMERERLRAQPNVPRP